LFYPPPSHIFFDNENTAPCGTGNPFSDYALPHGLGGHMAYKKLARTHPVWEDWLSAGLGLLIALSSSLTGDEAGKAVQLNSILIGLLVLLVAFMERVRLHHWQEVAEIALGAWLVALPYIHDYASAGTLRYWHFALGAIVLLLALHELWRDWDASREDLSAHGW
jgi:hypothetical protein